MGVELMRRGYDERPQPPKEVERRRIQRQVNKFLRNGGEIQVCPTRLGNPSPARNEGPGLHSEKFPVSEQVGRIDIGGVPHLSRARVAALLGVTTGTVLKYVEQRGLVAPVKKARRLYFPEAAVLAFKAAIND